MDREPDQRRAEENARIADGSNHSDCQPDRRSCLGFSERAINRHSEDGTIQEERTYPRSADPTKSKG